MKYFILCLILLSFQSAAVDAREFHLKDGQTIEGDVQRETEDFFVLKSTDGISKILLKSKLVQGGDQTEALLPEKKSKIENTEPITASQEKTYTNPNFGYSITYPSAWKVLDSDPEKINFVSLKPIAVLNIRIIGKNTVKDLQWQTFKKKMKEGISIIFPDAAFISEGNGKVSKLDAFYYIFTLTENGVLQKSKMYYLRTQSYQYMIGYASEISNFEIISADAEKAIASFTVR